MNDSAATRASRAGLITGPLIAALVLAFEPPAGLSQQGWAAAACSIAMAVWWMTEAAPLPVTALLPLIAFPLLGIADGERTARAYANPLVFLFLGGFVMAKALER